MESSINIDEACSDHNDEGFFFESDHLALRGNADYIACLRTLAVLEAQRIQAAKDIDRLVTIEKECCENPQKLIEKIRRGESLDLPDRINIVDLPKVNFEKYGVSFPEEFKEKRVPYISNDIRIRGRVFDQTKPITFNQLWTCEEQRRLEELLVEYPPEPVEMRRFAKIARALGNRTTQQVASRIQKYFKKLYVAGMPVPGRLPKSGRKKSLKMRQYSRVMARPSTFFPSTNVPFKMPEDEYLSGSRVSLDPNFYRRGCNWSNENEIGAQRIVRVDDDASDNESTQPNESQAIKLLQRIKRDKEIDLISERQPSQHDGFSCDFCAVEPIQGTRWHCLDCENISIDFCSDCLIAQMNGDRPHAAEHRMVAFRVISNATLSESEDDSDQSEDSKGNASDENGTSGFDKDYKFAGEDGYNYLDPNFLPK